MKPDETIAAISTPIGPGGIGIIRLSGQNAICVAERLVKSKDGPLASRDSHTTALAKIVDPSTGEHVDEVLVTIMKGPNSYTREDVVEINCHSGVPTLREVLRLVLAQGARLAEPGEFTRRAFISGRIDLTQAHAVIGLVEARNKGAARAAAQQADGHLAKKLEEFRHKLIDLVAELEAVVDFIDEDLEPITAEETDQRLRALSEEMSKFIKQAARGKVLDHGLTTAIVGRPNVGKSSLLNALALEDKAIVSPQPGTTRDVVEAHIQLGEVPLCVKDTAGWRSPGDDIEAQGISRTKKAIDHADLVILVIDGSANLTQEDKNLIALLPNDTPVIIALNKSDLRQLLNNEKLPEVLRKRPIVKISALTGAGIETLGASVGELLGMSEGAFESGASEAILASAMQEQNMADAKAKLDEAVSAQNRGFGEEVKSALVKEAIMHLDKISGQELDQEVLRQIFSRFCIGK